MTKPGMVGSDHTEFKQAENEVQERIHRLLECKGKRTPLSFHRELGKLLWDNCGMARNAPGLRENLKRIPELREEFWRNVMVPGSGIELNQSLEYAGRVADFLEFGELMSLDALERNESCGCHLREDFQTSEGEPIRNDTEFAHVAVWEYRNHNTAPICHRENLTFENVHLATRSYK
jgi:succinate dehydrogenase / fumarate reductase flavoprotein subunit